MKIKSSISSPRINPVLAEDRTAEQIRMLEPVFGDSPVPNLFATVLANEPLFETWLPFCLKLLVRSAFDRRERELVILRVAHTCSADYEWHHHVPIGRRAGLTDAEIERVTDRTIAEWETRDRALLAATDELLDRRTLDDNTWDALVAVGLSQEQLIELPMLVGHYALLAGTLNALGIRIEEPTDDDRPISAGAH